MKYMKIGDVASLASTVDGTNRGNVVKCWRVT